MKNWKCSDCGEINEAHYDVCCKKCGKDIKEVFSNYEEVPKIKSPFHRFRATGKNPAGSKLRIFFLKTFLYLAWIGFLYSALFVNLETIELYNKELLHYDYGTYDYDRIGNDIFNSKLIIYTSFFTLCIVTVIISLLIKFNNDLYQKSEKK